MRRSSRYGVKASFALLVVGLLPLLLVFLAGQIAEHQGCVLHEGHANPCQVMGHDIGEALYTMAVMGWLMLIGLPVAAAGALGLLASLLSALWRRLRG